MQQTNGSNLSKAIVLAATILGSCIVLASIIFASGSSNTVSLFSQWSMSEHLNAQLDKDLGGQVVVAGAKCRLDGVMLRDTQLIQDGRVLYLVCDASVYPEQVQKGFTPTEGHVLLASVLNKRSDGSYGGIFYIGQSSANVVL